MDELAYELGIDPVELRLRNHTDGRPARQPVVERRAARSACGSAPSGSAGPAGTRRRARRRDGDWLIGTGMAAAGYPVAFFMPPQRARARIYADGSAVVQTGTQEFGTGVAHR